MSIEPIMVWCPACGGIGGAVGPDVLRSVVADIQRCPECGHHLECDDGQQKPPHRMMRYHGGFKLGISRYLDPPPEVLN